MPLHALDEDDLRDHCRRALESLELWLRRLIDETLTEAYDQNFMTAQDDAGDYIIKSQIRKYLARRVEAEPDRYARPIDAALLDHLVAILCKREL